MSNYPESRNSQEHKMTQTNTNSGNSPSYLSETDWYSIAIIAAGVMAFATAQGASYPLTALMLANRGASDFVVSLGTVSIMIGMGLSVLIGPYLTKGMSAKSVMVFGLSGMGAVFAAFVAFESIAVWFLLRFFQGFFFKCCHCIRSSLAQCSGCRQCMGPSVERLGCFYGSWFCARPDANTFVWD